MTAPTSSGHWITKPFWQVVSGSLIALCIFAAGFIPFIAVQSEKNQRQQDFQTESLARDKEIHKESVRVTCGILKGFNSLTPPIKLNGSEDEATILRIAKANQDRLNARATLRASMPDDIAAECPIDGDLGGG